MMGRVPGASGRCPVKGMGRGMLEVFGLDAVAQAIYDRFLTHSGEEVQELAEHLGLTESQVRGALDALIDAGFIRHGAGRLRAVDPEVGIESLLRREEGELALRQQALAARRASAARVLAELAQSRPKQAADSVNLLVGAEAMQREMEVLAKNVVSMVRTTKPGSALPVESLEAARPLDEQTLLRGVAIRALYQDVVRKDPATFGYAQWMTELGGEVRTAPVLPPPMLLCDRTVAIVLVDPEERTCGALCIRAVSVVEMLITLFEQAWEMAVPLGAERVQDVQAGLSASELELLKLLSGGLTDERAAKRLGVSVSTVRRQMASLMERLGATSRFEAGLRAAQRGWI